MFWVFVIILCANMVVKCNVLFMNQFFINMARHLLECRFVFNRVICRRNGWEAASFFMLLPGI
jgi:hypothetical protein